MRDPLGRCGYFEQKLIELEPGRLLAAAWTVRFPDYADQENHFALSTDGGRTWTPPTPAGLPWPDADADLAWRRPAVDDLQPSTGPARCAGRPGALFRPGMVYRVRRGGLERRRRFRCPVRSLRDRPVSVLRLRSSVRYSARARHGAGGLLGQASGRVLNPVGAASGYVLTAAVERV